MLLMYTSLDRNNNNQKKIPTEQQTVQSKDDMEYYYLKCGKAFGIRYSLHRLENQTD